MNHDDRRESEMNSHDDELAEPAALPLASLTLSADEAHVTRLVNQIVERALALRARRQATISISAQALSWARPVLAAAALLVGGTWTLAAVRAGPTSGAAPNTPIGTSNVGTIGTTNPKVAPQARIAAWAEQNATPDSVTILAVFTEGAGDGAP
jgi:hypothetical protein